MITWLLTEPDTMGLFVVPWKYVPPPGAKLTSSFTLLYVARVTPVVSARAMVSVAPLLVD